ncbi:acyl-CoA synthetase (AMP-forming)/AMP-acid ligase II [Limimaricola soesokkakensis]|uniref:Acyl-CoA synthetase (AMP-forming)/AMP-acid ligase II n=1 Tax=Limimaricola soesokkakensis TaxID=1343159 RepID=A0A1X6ZNZ9_9RHOB|nr:AMP-binding protein [Limimaricola soesokkakensis]PSK85812.1 acyl-CoA synthetase (AMP-forming)/AMP-acid ligase II [Limimaricola soesokkakensis]SLN56789.1 Linear gramicidin synthase subunit D [Limimaricola soesokkakensis]
MTLPQTVGAALVRAIAAHASRPAMADEAGGLSYGQLGSFVERSAPYLEDAPAVGIFGAPGLAMAASATACVIHGRPFVHLDPAMPQAVLHNICEELGVTLVLTCQPVAPGHLPRDCEVLDARGLLETIGDAPMAPLQAAPVRPDAAIYLVATSGTTGRPKCIPVTQDAAQLSYEWRDAYTPYAPGMRVGIYIFAIWEMFRPLRMGAELWFPDPNTLMNPRGLAGFLIRNRIDEMLFTPSFYNSFLTAIDRDTAAALPLRRVVLNGEVVGDGLISASLDKLPGAELWNLYSICETHDVCMSRLTGPCGDGPASVGVPMRHLRAVILDETDRPCPPGVPGQLHFEGPRMLGPGYVNRPEETRLRFRVLDLEGREARLYDTGDQAWVDADGALHIIGRVAHMLKLRGFSIQTRELTDTMRGRLDFAQAVPWVGEVGTRGQALIFYFAVDAAQARANADRWGLGPGTNRMPAALAAELRGVLPAYCVPAYLVQLDAIPLHPVSGKADLRALPPVTETADAGAGTEDAVIAAAARVMGRAPDEIDGALSFHDQGGDSLMCVSLILELERCYDRPVDFELAMNVPLDRLHRLLTEARDTATGADFDRRGILLTGATGFLGGHVLARAARDLPPGHVVYCLVRDKRRDAAERLAEAARRHGVAPERYVMVPGTLDTPRFGLDPAAYDALAARVGSVVHCAATVNMAIGRDDMLDWSARGIETVLGFCRAAGADLRFSSSSAVFPEQGGPWPEGPAQPWEGCTGYGAAKIAAEAAIAASGVPAAIIRLPSLYDLEAPNPRDICEIILAAAFRAGVFPQAMAFPMIDVTAAAAVLLGPVTGSEVPIYNLVAETRVTHDGALPARDWVEAVDLPSGIARVIAETPETLRADATFDSAAARTAWAQVSEMPFEAISDAAALLARRRAAYQSEPALT